MEQRRETGAVGPVGLLLETLHINASTLDDKGAIRQWNQATIDTLTMPYEDVKTLWRQSLVRTRTSAAANTRKEVVNLNEIDFMAKAFILGLRS